MSAIKFNIITVCLNSIKHIEKTIHSVISQSYSDFNYYIIDGGSTDGTLDLIKKYKNKHPDKIHYISETDKGLYDAMNKGLSLVSDLDSFVIFLNSDDYFFSSNILEFVAEKGSKSDFIYGNVEILYRNSRRIFGYKTDKIKILRRTICHQAIFAKRSLFDQVGFFNLEYNFVADHDFVLKVFSLKNINVLYIPEIISSVRSDGLSSNNSLIARKEYFRVIQKHTSVKNLAPFLYTYIFLLPRILLLNIIYYLRLEKFRKALKNRSIK